MSVLASSVANRDDQISFFLLVDMEHLTHRGNLTPSKVSIDDKLNIRLFPNPAYNEINIQLINFHEQQNIKFQLYDFTGKVVHEQSLNTQNTKFLIDHLKGGIYFAYLSSNGIQKDVKKIVLIR